jgi:site-specific DNA-methyltransferase (cytosine-N4-specific)
MRQLSLFDNRPPHEMLTRKAFSHDQLCSETARQALEERYSPLLEETDAFSRQIVSFQANKTETLHRWIKYREGFSATLVELLMEKMGVKPGDTVLDPFAGSCTTLLTAKMMGVNSVGIELLPHCHLAWEAKSRAFDYDLAELQEVRQLISDTEPPPASESFPHLRITATAFSEDREADLMAYTRWVETLDVSEDARILLRLILTSILEWISFTRKDGQYLRWDGRAEKIKRRNRKRIEKGKKPFKGINKGPLPTVKVAVLQALDRIILDIEQLQKDSPTPSRHELIAGSTLEVLPQMEPDQFTGVITSPPYANRYDYTRTYALELAYLGVEEEIFTLRQRQLSCTVENKPKLEELEDFYRSIGRHGRYQRIVQVIENNDALAEINQALQMRAEKGEINNKGVLRMIENYFAELAFVFAELHRVSRSGAQIAFVNDNVRYAGEIIPVDLLSTNLAEQVGFAPVKVYVLPQRKGNSSQQMGRYGRAALRKSITIWQKP